MELEYITSTDGTRIAFDQIGTGPPAAIVSGAMCSRQSDAALATALASSFTVLNYDRRGRGDSDDTGPYAIEREIEDLAAVLDAAGGSAVVIGLSSGGALALRAAAAGLPISRLVCWEVPYSTDAAARDAMASYRCALDRALTSGDNGQAVELFLRLVGMPDQAITGMRRSPFWGDAERIAPTLAYDAAVMDDGAIPTDLLQAIDCPTAMLTGAASPPMFASAATETVAALDDGLHRVLDGQTHDVDAASLAAAVREFVGCPA